MPVSNPLFGRSTFVFKSLNMVPSILFGPFHYITGLYSLCGLIDGVYFAWETDTIDQKALRQDNRTFHQVLRFTGPDMASGSKNFSMCRATDFKHWLASLAMLRRIARNKSENPYAIIRELASLPGG